MKIKTKELTLFALLGAFMYASKMLMEFLPNIHLLGVFTVTFTVVYRKKALIPIYIYVAMLGLFAGLAPWWVPHIYLWTVLWGMVMLLPKQMSKKIAPMVYAVVCALHGFLFGVIYSPAQALLFGLDFKGMIAWIAAGLPFDLIHGISNLCVGLLICPLVAILRKAEKQ